MRSTSSSEESLSYMDVAEEHQTPIYIHMFERTAHSAYCACSLFICLLCKVIGKTFSYTCHSPDGQPIYAHAGNTQQMCDDGGGGGGEYSCLKNLSKSTLQTRP